MKVLTYNTSLQPFLWAPERRIDDIFCDQSLSTMSSIHLQEVCLYRYKKLVCDRLKSFPHISYTHGLFGPKAGLVSFFKEPIRTISFMGLGFQKGILVSTLASGLVVANIHLTANTDGDWSMGNRFYARQKWQLTLVNRFFREYIKGKSGMKNDIFLVGDFNISKESDLYHFFMNDGRWYDMTPHDFSPTFISSFLPKDRFPQRIDFIFANKDFKTESSGLLFGEKAHGKYLSNHMGVVAEIDPVVISADDRMRQKQ